MANASLTELTKRKYFTVLKTWLSLTMLWVTKLRKIFCHKYRAITKLFFISSQFLVRFLSFQSWSGVFCCYKLNLTVLNALESLVFAKKLLMWINSTTLGHYLFIFWGELHIIRVIFPERYFKLFFSKETTIFCHSAL